MEPPIFSSCLLPLLYNSRVFSTLKSVYGESWSLWLICGLPGNFLTEGIVGVCNDSLSHELIHDDISVPDLYFDSLGGVVSVQNNREVELRVERVLHRFRSQLCSLAFDEDIGVSSSYQVLLQQPLGGGDGEPGDHHWERSPAQQAAGRGWLVSLQAGQPGAALTEQTQEESAVLAGLESTGEDKVAAWAEVFPHEDVGGPDVVTGAAVALRLRNQCVQTVLPVRLHLQHVETNHQLGSLAEISIIKVIHGAKN